MHKSIMNIFNMAYFNRVGKNSRRIWTERDVTTKFATPIVVFTTLEVNMDIGVGAAG